MRRRSAAIIDPREICICGAPCFRHRRLDGSQMDCAALRLIDEQFEALPSAAQQPQRAFHTTARIIQFSEKVQ